jgi:ketosteroid isomerase-like protein
MSDLNSAKQVLIRYEGEINKHNFDLLQPLISKDCTFWFSSGTFSGLEQTRSAFEKTWRTIQDEIYSITNVEWIAESDLAAACIYTFNWEGMVSGQLRKGKGRGTSCFRLEGTEWKIIHEHLSSFPAGELNLDET